MTTRKRTNWGVVRPSGDTVTINTEPATLPERYDGWWTATGKVGRVAATGVPSREYEFFHDDHGRTGERLWVDDNGEVYLD